MKKFNLVFEENTVIAAQKAQLYGVFPLDKKFVPNQLHFIGKRHHSIFTAKPLTQSKFHVHTCV
jgi:hypothetical protein